VSLYPLKTDQASSTINQSINSLHSYGVDYSVGSMSTHLEGSEEQVWDSLKGMFYKAQEAGEVSMVVTITNAAH
ncbi:MAG: thiamine-binding protein, partial [Firmicutes bacterium]|nr:thiamine-binding protein [Bacillota bacterium]